MAWTSLKDSLSSKPFVLAGPILRKVTPTSVTVWLAMWAGGDVTLTVLDALNAPMATGQRHTVAIGTQLHIVCVTAVPTADLVEGVIYRYNLAFAFDDGQAMDLPTATGTQTVPGAFAYVPFGLPSFCLPPASLDDLRILCGSCRIPHGNGRDCFSIGDKLIAQAASNPLGRPHQLLLTGDQIYADDVSASQLMVLSDAAHVLLGWKEQIPYDDAGGKADVDKLLPFLRRDPLEATGFTSEDLDGQLLSLGEYLCMYIMVWSDVLWPADMPTFGDVAEATRVVLGGDPIAFSKWFGQRVKKGHHFGMDREATKLALFRKDLPDVRRMMANIPSYMICDDHEVTDDWNMTRDTCKSLYGHQLGLRVAQNALVAYSLCQHWGNVPEVFEGTGPGKAMLDLLNGTDAARYETNSPALRKLVAVHEESVLATQPDNAVFHDPDSLIFNFTVEGPGHQVIFTDSRTWRSFPTGRVGGGVLLPSDQLAKQIVATPTIRRPVRDRGDDHQRAGRGAAPLRRPARLHHQPRPAPPGCLRGVGAAVDPFRSPDGEPEREAAAGRRATNRGAGADLGRRAFQLRDAAALQGQHARRGHAAAPAGQGGDRAVGRELVPQGDRQHTRIPSQRVRLRAARVLMARGPQDDARRGHRAAGLRGLE